MSDPYDDPFDDGLYNDDPDRREALYEARQEEYDTAYVQGEDAFRAGQSIETNPYEGDVSLLALLRGWYDGYENAQDEAQRRISEVKGTTIESLVNKRTEGA